MSSWIKSLKAGSGQTSSASGTPTKKDPNAPIPTPLEKLLANAGPLRTDGSDKFFGFENFGSTCYCNSIIQCLYYSVPFREQVINFPRRAPADSFKNRFIDQTANDDPARPLSGSKPAAALPVSASPRTKAPPPTAQQGPPKPEDNKDSPEYKKKVALQTGPVLNMDFKNADAYGMPESLFTSLKDIFEAVIAHDSRMGIVSPHKFLEILRRDNEMFRTPMHQDAHEFLNLLLNEVVENVEQYSKTTESNGKLIESAANAANGLTNAMAPVVNSIVPSSMQIGTKQGSRWVHELFEGTLTSETRCLTCENVSQRDEVFLDLSVDLEQHSSVTSCLRRFSEEEMLCERNKFHCDRCSGLQEAEKRMKIKRLPRILALHLKRFKYTEDMQRLQKLFHRVVYPYYLRLFNTTDDAEDPDRLYELYAVVIHIGGGPYHGHYVSIIKTPDRGWLLFDDEMVEPVDKRFVTKFFGEGLDGNGHPKNLACAYVLFYQETTVEAMQRELDSEGVPPTAMGAEAQSQPKANGFANGSAHVASTPITEEVEQFAHLDHAATAPMPMHTPPLASAPFANPLEHAPSSPNLPFLKRKKSQGEMKAKEEQKRLEKEQHRLEKEEKERRKAEEKEAEKQAKIKKKEAEAARKESQKKQEEDLAARYKNAGRSQTLPPASSNTSSQAVSDDQPMLPNASTPGRPSGLGLHTEESSRNFTPPPHAPTSHPNGLPMPKGDGEKNMLHRFRNTSMSFRQKPGKFWGSSHKDKDKEKEKLRKSEDGLSRRPSTPEEQLNESLLGGSAVAETGHGEPPRPSMDAKKEKKGFSMGLGRKKSVNLLSKGSHH